MVNGPQILAYQFGVYTNYSLTAYLAADKTSIQYQYHAPLLSHQSLLPLPFVISPPLNLHTYPYINLIPKTLIQQAQEKEEKNAASVSSTSVSYCIQTARK